MAARPSLRPGSLLAAAAVAAALAVPAAAQQPGAGPHLLGLPVLAPAPAVIQSSVGIAAPGGAPASPAPPPAPGALRSGAGITSLPLRDQVRRRCGFGAVAELRRNPRPGELRCLFGVDGPGAFGLLSYLDVPVYQSRTPMPGTHVVGIPGLPQPLPRESYEEWEWRMLRTPFGPEARTVHRDIESLDPVVASRVLRLEALLRQEGVRFARRETWRSPDRQAYLFQQGRSRPGPLATATLTSWHSRVDRLGRPAGRAVDYDVPGGQMGRFHRAAAQVGLDSYGADSNDPGHVYYVGSEFLAPSELAVMRTLPRVTYVTLETGRPADEAAAYGRLSWHQERERIFAAFAFEPVPQVEPVLVRTRVRAIGTEPLTTALHRATDGPPPPSRSAPRR